MSRNIIGEYIEFNKKNFETYTKKIMDKFYDEALFNKYLETYVNVRYYNEETRVRNTFDDHIEFYLNKVYEQNNTKPSKFILELFRIYFFLDDILEFNYDKDINLYAETINKVRIDKLGINEENFTTEFKEMILENTKKKETYIENLDNHDFYLDITELSINNLYNVNIKQDANIPRLFSNYAINKVWNEKKMTEDKTMVEYYMLNQIILKDLIQGDFESEYLVDLPYTLYEKKDKLKATLDIFDNNIAKDLITIKINYKDFITNKEVILEYIKNAYQFAVVLDDEYLNNSNKTIIDIFKYIIIKDEKYQSESLKQKNNIITIE